ncbi:MAG TPA: SRPBCC family protein [Candidatus Acidoferrum sp.]|nr:SRPBCC family protein [Candidatus Acidoferrum sp.]
MAEAKSSSAAGHAQQELILTRILGAPRSLVFRVWTDAKHVQRWWSPRGFTNPVCELDVRPGGLIRIDMRGPDGTIHPMKGVFHEIVEPERLVFTGTALEDEHGKPSLEILNTVTFEDFHGITKLTLHARLVTKDFKLTPQVAAALAGMEQGWSESLYRLADEIENSLAAALAAREIVLSRVFDAPREMVWNAWTDPKQIVKWWGPRGFTTTIHEMDVRPGGVWRQTMHGPDGANYPGKSVFTEVVKYKRIVFSHSGGKEGGPGASFKSTWTFEVEGDQTKVTIRMVFDSAEARELVVKEFGAIEGGKQTLARLGEYLAESIRLGSVRN